jgi:hypothetical protein
MNKHEKTIGYYLRGIALRKNLGARQWREAKLAWQELQADKAKLPSEMQGGDAEEHYAATMILIEFARVAGLRDDVRRLRALRDALEPNYIANDPKRRTSRFMTRWRRGDWYRDFARIPGVIEDLDKAARKHGFSIYDLGDHAIGFVHDLYVDSREKNHAWAFR